MPDSAGSPDLKILIARDELLRFMDQLNAIAPTPLSLIDSNGTVIYENGCIRKAAKRTIDPADKGCHFPIKINNIQIGAIVGRESIEIQRDKLIGSMKHIGEMLTDRLAYEFKVDSLASEIINGYQELNLLYEISEPLSSVLDAETICEVALKQAVDTIGPKKAFMMLLDAEREQLTVAASAGVTRDMKGLRVKIEGSIFEGVIQVRNPFVIEDAEKYPHLKSKINRASIISATPLICVPVSAKGEVFGVISMSEKLSGESFTSADTKLLCAIASQVGMSLGNARLYGNLSELFLSTVAALAAAVEAKDPRTHGHCRRVAEYSISIGQEMGLPGREISDLRLAGVLHDIGKIGISESILSKPDGLTEEELAEIKSHPVKGAKIIGHIEQMHDIALWIRHHHERYDGTGYPDGLRGEEIPLHSRILAVVDAYDSMTSDRSHRPRHPHDAAVLELRTGSGSQFDTEIADIFLSLVVEDAYEQYLETYQKYKHPLTRKLSRFEYYRIDNEISDILAQEALGYELSELEQGKLQELRESVLRY